MHGRVNNGFTNGLVSNFVIKSYLLQCHRICGYVTVKRQFGKVLFTRKVFFLKKNGPLLHSTVSMATG